MEHDLKTVGRPNALAGPSSEMPQQPFPKAPTNNGIQGTPPPSNSHHPLPKPSSPTKNLETVSAFLSDRAGKPISEVEMEGLLYLIEKSTPTEEPFRFSSSTPSTPVRGNSPFLGNINNISFGIGSPTAQTPTPSPRKTLNRNPNGLYRWEGGGSAKASRSRNRYSSPAFGPSRSTSDRIVLKDSQTTIEAPKADTKRRRVGDEALSSSATSSGSGVKLPNGDVVKPPPRAAAPDPSPTRTKQVLPFPVSNGLLSTPRAPNTSTSKVNGTPASSRLRVPPVPQKPTVPVVPSPLRQAWSGASPPSQRDTSPKTPPQQKQTKAANFMAELIKEVTPPKRPDLSNPYQTASPVNKAAPPKARAGKRVRATGRPAVPGSKEEKNQEKSNNTEEEKKEKDKVYSPQAIIEATLPKGSKRSRPPAHFEKSTSQSSRETSLSPDSSPPERNGKSQSDSKKSFATYVVEEIDEDDEETKRATKKAKPHLSGRGGGRRTALSPSPDIVIEEIEDVDIQTPFEKPKSVVSPPSTSEQASSGAAPSSSSNALSGRTNFAGFKSTSAPKEPSKLRYSYQPEGSSPSLAAVALPFVPAPVPTVTPPSPAPVPAHNFFEEKKAPAETPQRKPIAAKDAALTVPMLSLPTFVFSVTSITSVASPYAKARADALALPKASLPPFDFSAQTLKGVSASNTSTTPALVKAFDWAAAGMKPAGGSVTGANWTCSTCMLSNPATATDKCTICDSPRAEIKLAGGNATAANWTCSTCMLSNPVTATDKCTICDSPR